MWPTGALYIYHCCLFCAVQNQPGEEQAESGEWQQRDGLWGEESAAGQDGVRIQEEESGGPAAGVYGQGHRGRENQGWAVWTLTQTPGKYLHRQFYCIEELKHFSYKTEEMELQITLETKIFFFNIVLLPSLM